MLLGDPVFDAVGVHGDLRAAKDMPPCGRPNTREACMHDFADPRDEPQRDVWPLSRPEEHIERLQQGTARMAAIAAQDLTVLPRIAADVARQAEQYRKGDHILMPIAALVASAVKAQCPSA
jgi:hypothetical protein